MRNITRARAPPSPPRALPLAAASAQQPVVLQWQTANLTEIAVRAGLEATIAEFEAANPGHQDRARARRAQGPLDQVRRRRAGEEGAVHRHRRPHDRGVQRLPDAARQVLERGDPRSSARRGATTCSSARKWKGQLYGLPIWGGTYAEIYNRDLGRPRPGSIPRKPPKNWAEYLAWSKKLTGNDQWATAVLGGKTDTTTRVLLTWIWSNGGEAFNADMTEATFAKNPKSLEAIKFYLGLVKDGVAAPGADDHELSRADEAVRAGQDRDDAQRATGPSRRSSATTRR